MPAWRRHLGGFFAARPRLAWSGASFVGVAAAVLLTAGTFGLWPGGSPRASRRHVRPTAPVAEDVEPSTDVAAPGGTTIRAEDAAVIVHLDELTETNDNAVWLDDDDESAS